MSRRTFLKSFTTLLAGMTLPAILQAKTGSQYRQSKIEWKTLQTFPVAGFQYYHGESLWPQLAANQRLILIREPDNSHDKRAVRIDWQGLKLGYVPRDDNAAISQLMDRGETLSALITGLRKSHNPWERIEVEVKWQIQINS